MSQTGLDMQHIPEFRVGDLVSERAATAKRVGTVVQVYELAGELRIVVRFEEGSEAVFFASELLKEK